MSSLLIDDIKASLTDRHTGDQSQLDVIFSPQERILVEAPAGYGKTNTMVSKIACMLATGQIPYPKRLLALTFSVNAAYKIKKDVSQQIPELLQDIGSDINISDKVFVSNYHGFCRGVLRKYGHKFHSSLFEIDKLRAFDDANAQEVMGSIEGLLYDDAILLSNFNAAIKNVNSKFINDNFIKYNEIIVKNIIPKGAIPFNAILTLTIELFTNYPVILDFYQSYFAAILVDEYQDTNILGYKLVAQLIVEKTKVILLGDSLQRIYGFIGAVPNLLSISEKKFGLTKFQLNKNHRFASNQQMLQLDFNIRRNAENPSNPTIEEDASVDLEIVTDQVTESSYILEKSLALTKEKPESEVAILVRQRGPNTNAIVEIFDENNIPYFYGLFTDEDVDYVKFHSECLSDFIQLIQENDRITKSLGSLHINGIKKTYNANASPLYNSLMILLEIFWGKVFTDFSFFSNEEKILLIKDTFEYNSLKQYIEFVDANIIISTIHAAKGLEWDFVILPDMEQNRFPSWYGLCSKCVCREDCKLLINQQIEREFLEELSVFYVAVTRARKQVSFSASQLQLDSQKNERTCNLSCFLKLPGIKTTSQ
jgi:DNA helicase-2/ATP-dependent DNA helicase PcrA